MCYNLVTTCPCSRALFFIIIILFLERYIANRKQTYWKKQSTHESNKLLNNFNVPFGKSVPVVCNVRFGVAVPGSKPSLDHIIFHEFDRFRFLFFMVTGVQTIHRQEARVLLRGLFFIPWIHINHPSPPKKNPMLNFSTVKNQMH